MAENPKVDYEALAKQYGGTSTKKSAVDYSALAKQYGGTSTPASTGDADVTPSQDFSAQANNTEGLYDMIGKEGKPINVPYSKVMDAYRAGYKISPKDQDTYRQDRAEELKKQGKHGEHPEVPEAYTTVGPAPLMLSPEWFEQKKVGAEHAVLDALPTAGMVVGGALGAGAGAPAGPAAVGTASLGAAAGGGLGETLRQSIGEHVFTDEPKLSAKESAEKIATEAAQGALAEGGGRIAGKVIGRVAKPFVDTLAASKAAGVRLLPSEAAGKAPGFVEKFLKDSVFTKGTMEKWRVLQNTEAQAAVDKIANRMAISHGTSEELGKELLDGIAEHQKNFRAIQNKMYGDIDAEVGEHTVKEPIVKKVPTGLLDASGKPLTRDVTTYAEKQVDKVMPSTVELKKFAAQELKKLSQTEQILSPSLLHQSREMLETILKAPDNMTYSAIASARSDALSKARELDQALAGKQAGLAKKMASLFDESMIQGAEKSKIPGLVDKIRAANDFTRTEHEMFDQQLVKKIAETKKPEAITTFLRAKGNGLQETRDLFTVLPKDLHDPVRRQLLLDTMRQATNVKTGIFNEGRFAESMLNMDDGRGEVIFGDNWKNVKRLSKIMGNINGPVGRNGGSAAGLNNYAVLKNLMLAAIPLGFFGATKDWHTGAQSAVGEAATLTAIAYGMTHPETAVKMLGIAQKFARTLPYAVSGATDEAEGRKQLKKGRAQEEFDKAKKPDVKTLKKEAEARKPQAVSQ